MATAVFNIANRRSPFIILFLLNILVKCANPKKKRWPPPAEKSAGPRHFILKRRDTIPIDQAAAYRILPLSAAIPRVSLHGIDNAVLTFFYNAHMICFSISLPVEEDNHAGCRFNGIIRPLATHLKPVGTIDTTVKLGDHAGINIAALVGAPRHEAGTPFHTTSKTIPRPVWLTSHIADLRESHSDNGIILAGNSIQHSRP